MVDLHSKWFSTVNPVSQYRQFVQFQYQFQFQFNSIWCSNFRINFQSEFRIQLLPHTTQTSNFIRICLGFFFLSFYVASHIQLTCDWFLICHHLHRFIRIAEINTTRNADSRVYISNKLSTISIKLHPKERRKYQKSFGNHLSVCLLVFCCCCFFV